MNCCKRVGNLRRREALKPVSVRLGTYPRNVGRDHASQNLVALSAAARSCHAFSFPLPILLRLLACSDVCLIHWSAVKIDGLNEKIE